MLFGDLINTVKQRTAGRTEEERKSHKELLDTPEFIFDETQHQAKHELRLIVRGARTFHFLVAHTSHPFVHHKCMCAQICYKSLLCMHSHTCSHMSHACVCAHTWSQLILCLSVRCITKRSRPRQPRRETICLSPASAQPCSPEDRC